MGRAGLLRRDLGEVKGLALGSHVSADLPLTSGKCNPGEVETGRIPLPRAGMMGLGPCPSQDLGELLAFGRFVAGFLRETAGFLGEISCDGAADGVVGMVDKTGEILYIS